MKSSELIDALIRIKDSHRDLTRQEVDAINEACNRLEEDCDV